MSCWRGRGRWRWERSIIRRLRLSGVEALHPDRSLGHSPLFQAMLVLQAPDRTGDGLGLAGVEAEALELGSLGSKFDVTLSLAEAGGGLRVGWSTTRICSRRRRWRGWRRSWARCCRGWRMPRRGRYGAWRW